MTELWHRQKKRILFFASACALVGIGGVALVFIETNTVCTLSRYSFINKRIACLYSEREESERFGALENDLRRYAELETLSGRARKVSIFVRDLESLRWLGVNENENYAPASLLKLPILLAYLKYTEVDPSILSRSILYEGGTSSHYNSFQNHSKEASLVLGERYTYEELLERMMIYSSNLAADILVSSANEAYLMRVFEDFGITLPQFSVLGSKEKIVSAKIYGAVFRALYNANYLAREKSEYALSLMSRASFKEGIVAGVPEGVVVSHKFGDRILEEATLYDKALHDCGIVYGARPYIVCVMTEGKDFRELAQVIAGVSGIVYRAIGD